LIIVAFYDGSESNVWPPYNAASQSKYVDAACCYRRNSVARLSVCHTSEPCKNDSTDPDVVWEVDSGGPKEACVRWGCTSLPPGKSYWTVHVRQRCGLVSNYFDHLLILVVRRLKSWCEDIRTLLHVSEVKIVITVLFTKLWWPCSCHIRFLIAVCWQTDAFHIAVVKKRLIYF